MPRRLFCLWLILLCITPNLAFAENTVDLMGYRICIDPGHQARLDDRVEPVAPGSTTTKPRAAGCAQGVKTRRRESAINLEIAFKLRDTLEAMGAEVLLVRDTEDIQVSNVQRAQMANQFRADVFLRLHCNKSDDPKRRGICIYSPKRGAERFLQVDSAQMLAWAQSCADIMKEATGAKSAKAAVNDTYSGSNWAQMPTFLIEMGYLSNVEDDLLLSTEVYQAGVIQGMAAFIATMPLDAYRDHALLQSPVMANHKNMEGPLMVYEQPDADSKLLTKLGRGYRVFVMDDLGDDWYQVQTYQRGAVGYTNCSTLTPCR